MKALILNSGLGHRMGVLTSEHPKCMTEVFATQTILSRQLQLLATAGIQEVVITTGYFDQVLMDYCRELDMPLRIQFIKNPRYAETNYIYSIYCAREALRGEDVLLMHGDLVFEPSVLDDLLAHPNSCMKVSSTLPLPQKDFKAVVQDGQVKAVGIEFFDSAMEAQALYKLNAADWQIWLDQICALCENGQQNCYAEVALNQVTDRCHIDAFDVQDRLCTEVDTPEDLAHVKELLRRIEERTVYMCFSTDVLHSGHIALLRKAQKLGKVIVGVLSDEAVVTYKRYPLLPFEDRKALFESIAGISKIVKQETLSYGLSAGTYVMDEADAVQILPSRVTFRMSGSRHEFVFMLSPISSYYMAGDYTINDGLVTCSDGTYTLVFKIQDNDTIVLQIPDQDGLHMSGLFIPNGTEFYYEEPSRGTLTFHAEPASANAIRADFRLDFGEALDYGEVWAECWQDGACTKSEPLVLNREDEQLHLSFQVQGSEAQNAPAVQVSMQSGASDAVLTRFALPDTMLGFGFKSYEDGQEIYPYDGDTYVLAALAPDLGDGVRQVDCIDLSMEPALYEQAACMVLVKAAFGSDEFPHG